MAGVDMAKPGRGRPGFAVLARTESSPADIRQTACAYLILWVMVALVLALKPGSPL